MIHLSSRSSKEQAQAAIKRATWKSDEEISLRESFRSRLNVDIANQEEFPVSNPDFSWGAAKEKLREADGTSTHLQLLRAGIQAQVNQMYSSVETTYSDWAHVITSSKAEELYAPLHGIGFPSMVGEGEQYPEVGALGLDIRLKNYKGGQLFPVMKELLEDDQTGQVSQMASLLGEYCAQLVEVWVYGKLASVANMSYAGVSIPVSETKPSGESVYPWSTSLIGGGATRPAAYSAFSQSAIQDGMIALMNQKNLLGLKMSVKPSRILISPKYQFDASVLLNSAYYPSGSAGAGSTGGAFAINPIKGIADLTVARFMFDQNGTVDGNSKAWYLVDDSKPAFVVQMRTPCAVTSEDPNSGDSFNRDTVRFKATTRFNADFIDPRFFWRGSDGSV